MSIDGAVSVAVALNDRRSIGINTSANLPVNTIAGITFSNGVGVGQANILYQASLAMTSGAYALDLYNSITDSYGTTVLAARVKAIYFKNTSAHTITIGAGTATMVTFLNAAGTITLPPGGWFIAATPSAAGWVVTATTADRLNLTGTTTDTFDVVILGGLT